MKKFTKRFISYFLIIVMVATVFVNTPVVASAEDTVATLTYSVSDGIATITGIAENGNIIRIPDEYEGAPVARISAEGASKFHMSNTITAYIVDEDNQYFSSDENGVLYNYDKTELINYPAASLLTDFTTPASVKTIADYAFRGVINLQNVTLNEGIVNIGSYAFWTSNIVNISLPESLQTISKSAFWHSEKLTGINLPKNLISIGDAAFENCYSIEYFSVHPENTYFSSDEKGVLYNKNKSELYQYPAGSTEIEFNVPLSVVIIKRGAFAYSENLRRVVLHNNIIEMETNVFQGSGIEYIDIPESLTAIPDYAFDDCGDLAAIAIHANITSVGVAAFRRCTSLKTVNLPDSITSIGKEAFRFSGIGTITLPKGLTTIESSVFHYCENLISVEIPVSVTKIENAFYYGNNSLTDIYYHGTEEQWKEIDIDEGNTELEKVKINYNYINGTHLTSEDFEYTISDGSVTINKCVKSGYVAIVIPDEIEGYPVTEIAANAFRDLTVAEVKLPSGLKKIGMYAFLNCTLLTKIHLPDTLEVLEPYAFNKTRIERLNIPESLTHLEPGSFGLCEYLTFFEVDKDNPSYRNDENGVIFSKDGSVLVEYPEAKPEETYIVPDGVKEIGDSAFKNLVNGIALKNIVLPDGLEVIGTDAFYALPGYVSVNLPDSLKKIGAGAFSNCRFSSVEIPKGVEFIGEGCFSSCSELTDVKINCEIREIPAEMFYLCKKLKTVNIPESVVSIGEKAFYGCESLTEIDLPDSVKSLGTRAFSNCKLLEKFDLPQGLTTLGEYVFDGCLHLTSITVDENNTAYSSDEYGVLFNKDKTKLIQYPMGNTRTSYEITDSVTSIGDYAFYNCNSLTSIIIGNGVTSIGDEVFYSCDSLTSVTISDGVTRIGDGAFSYCDNLTDVYYYGTEEEWNIIDIGTYNQALLNATIHYNYGKTSGALGENIFWSFDEGTKALAITGSGEMQNLASAEDYGWYFFKDEIETVEFANSVTSVSDYAFCGYPNLKEVYLGQAVESIGEKAFADCHALAIVTSRAINLTAEDSSFGNNDSRLVLLYNSSATQAADYASAHGMKHIPVYYDSEKKVINYKGALTVYSDLPYLFLSKLVKENPEAEYLYFEKLVFDGVETGLFDMEELQNDAQAQYLTFNNLYVSLKKIKDNSAEGVTFEAFITLLENGDYDSFIFELVSDEGEQQLTFEEIWEKVSDFFITTALRVTSKIINFFRKIFK